MNRLSLLMAGLIITSFAGLVASDKHVRRDQYERNVTAKEREIVKEALRHPNTGTMPVVATVSKLKSSVKK